MAEDIRGSGHYLRQIIRHVAVAVAVVLSAAAVVAHVDGDDCPRFGQSFGDDPPIACRPKEPMSNQKWCAGRSVICNRVQHASLAILVSREGPEGLSNLPRPTRRRA